MSRHSNRLVLLDSEHRLQILQKLRATLMLTYNMASASVIFVNDNENGEKRENDEFVNEN